MDSSFQKLAHSNAGLVFPLNSQKKDNTGQVQNYLIYFITVFCLQIQEVIFFLTNLPRMVLTIFSTAISSSWEDFLLFSFFFFKTDCDLLFSSHTGFLL